MSTALLSCLPRSDKLLPVVSMMRSAVFMLVFLAYSSIVSARPSSHFHYVQHTWHRALQQASTSNCTPPRTAKMDPSEDAKKPFCFVPETTSAQARQFLSQTAAGIGPFGAVNFSTDPRQQALVVAQLRTGFESIAAKETKAAMAKYIQSILLLTPFFLAHTHTLLLPHTYHAPSTNAFSFPSARPMCLAPPPLISAAHPPPPSLPPPPRV